MGIDEEIGRLGDEELLARLSGLVARSNATEAELLAVLAEVDERRLYLPRRTSLWDYCLHDLGFSENAAGNRIAVARESRRFPRMLEMLREGRVHLSGLRMLCGHLTAEDGEALLAAAAGKTKREIEELLARRCPKPAVPDLIRKLPGGGASTAAGRDDAALRLAAVRRPDARAAATGGRGAAVGRGLPGPVHGEPGAPRQDPAGAGAAAPPAARGRPRADPGPRPHPAHRAGEEGALRGRTQAEVEEEPAAGGSGRQPPRAAGDPP